MKKQYRKISMIAVLALLPVVSAQYAFAMTPQERLDVQQAQLDAQAAEINALKDQVRMLLDQSGKNQKLIAEKADKKEVEELKVDKMVSSKNTATSVTLYGQVNRAGLWADNGDESKFYFVDNSNSSTRMGVQADAKMSNGNGVGAKIEYEFKSNSSSAVNQLEESTGADIAVRHTDLWFAGNFGKLAIGRGDTASNGTAEVDLSGTGVVTYSSVEDLAGGQLWYDGSTDTLSEMKVGDVFSNMDGLSRRNRFRYDTPSFSGFSLAGSVVEEDAYDLAARYSRKYDGIEVATALAYASTGDLSSVDDQVSGSLSMLHNSGFNVTLAGGKQTYDADDRDDPVFWYGKLGYKTDLFSFGQSAFSIDYASNDDSKSNGDEASAYSIAYVQKVDEWASELYLAWRQYKLDKDMSGYDDINAIMMGARVKF